MRSIQIGDLVCTHVFGVDVFLGIVLDIQPMKDVYKDSNRGEKMNSVKILWEKPVPSWLGEGRICEVTDLILQVVEPEELDG